MGIVDRIKGLLGQAKDKAGDVAAPLADKAGDVASKAGEGVAKGVGKVGEGVDKATGGRFHEQIEKVADAVDDKIGDDDDPTTPKPETPA